MEYVKMSPDDQFDLKEFYEVLRKKLSEKELAESCERILSFTMAISDFVIIWDEIKGDKPDFAESLGKTLLLNFFKLTYKNKLLTKQMLSLQARFEPLMESFSKASNSN